MKKLSSKRSMFFKMVFSSIVRRRSRMIIALLAIIVGATILSGLVTIYYDVPRQMSAQFRNYGANVILTPGDSSYVEDSDMISAISYISSKELEGYTPYRYETTKVNNSPVTIAGITFSSIQKTSPYWYINGDIPTASQGECLIGAAIAETYGLSVGDKIKAINSFTDPTDEMDLTLVQEWEITYDPITGEPIQYDHELSLTITGIVETGGNEEAYLYMSLEDLTYLSLYSRGYDVVEVSISTTQAELQNYINKINSNISGVDAKLVKRVTASESSVLTKLQSLVFIVTAVVLVLTMICVATTMGAVIAERRKEIGLRKALGASNKDIVLEFMTEGLMLGGAGGIVGAILGYVFAEIVSLNVFASSITFRPLILLVTIVVSIVVTGLASLVPIKSSVEVDPALVLKGE